MPDKHDVTWIDHHREPVYKPDPRYPDGIDLDLTVRLGASGGSCKVALPYPTPRCGLYLIVCSVCGLRVGVTTAGRPDDPRSVLIPCKVAVH